MMPRKMTKAEAAWVRRLRAVMRDAPDTLELLTIGDPCLTVIDRALAGGDLHDGRAEDRGAVLAHVNCACRVHGVSG